MTGGSGDGRGGAIHISAGRSSESGGDAEIRSGDGRRSGCLNFTTGKASVQSGDLTMSSGNATARQGGC